MALRVWLPLNGNINNYGASEFQPVLHNSAMNFTQGKINQCATFTNSSSDNYPTTITIPTSRWQTFTICLWIKPSAYTGTEQMFIRDSLGYNGCGWSISTSPSANTFEYMVGSTGGTVSSITYTPGEWYHIAIAHDTYNHCRFYLNGEWINPSSGSGNTIDYDYNTDNLISIGGRSYNGSYPYPFIGSLSDVRMYDTSLTTREIKEIAEGPVIHYKLDTMKAIDNLKRNVAYGTYNNFASSGSTCTVVATGEYYNGAPIYRMTYTPNDTSLSSVQSTLHSHGVTTSGQTFTAGTKYCYWTLCKPISHPDTIVGGVASNIGNWTEIPMKEYGGGWYIVGQKRTGNATEDKTDTIFTSFKTPSATSDTPIIIDFCCPHLISGYDYILPEFNYQGTVLTYEPDSSGLVNHGTINGTLSSKDNSPRYERSTNFDTTSSYIKLPTLTTTGYANSFTFIWWSNITDMNGRMAWGFSDGNRLNLYPSSSNFCCNTGDGASNPYKDNNGNAVTFSTYNNGWHQYAMVGNGTDNKLYIDGQYKGKATTYKGITGTQIYISGWDTGTSYTWTGGQISDWRLYATALSAEDILTKYQISGIIYKNGNIDSYNFKEE